LAKLTRYSIFMFWLMGKFTKTDKILILRTGQRNGRAE